MKAFVILVFITFASITSSLPVPNDRIIFRDEDEDSRRVDDSPNDLGFDQLRLLSDSNLLKSDNTTKEFLFDEAAQQRLENGKFFQGDIVLMQDQLDILTYPDDDDEFGTRTGVLSENYRWPKDRSGKVIVPYSLAKDYCK